MNFECLNVSVAQKLTELQFFLYQQLLLTSGLPTTNVRGLLSKSCLPKSFGNFLDMNFEYLKVSVAQKLTELEFLAPKQVF